MVAKKNSHQESENICPVCGFDMEDPPRDYNICPSCGTEFGVNDVNATILELREAWMKTGPKWWSTTDPQPRDWDPFAQLAQVEHAVPVHTR
jgi:predicted amidophosphoribosyltransferase